MPMAFLNPALLFGALASALPVIIHFLSRKKVRRQKFSDMRFLTEVQARQARSLGVRRWILLMLRVLAILALTAAVAGPRWGGLATGSSGARSLVFILDTSASMNTQQEDGTRFEAALLHCGQMLESLPAETSVQVVTAGSRTGSVFGQWLPAGAGAQAGLSAIRPSDGPFDLPAAILETAKLVTRAPSQPVDVVLISDFQENPLPDELRGAVKRLQEAGQARLITHQVGTATSGGGIQDVQLPQRALQRSENSEIRAKVTSSLPDQVFTLELDGNQVAEAVLAEPSNTPVPLIFSLSVPGPGLHTGRVRKPSDAFSGDDERPFVLSVPTTISVLLVHGADRPVDPVAGRGGWRYLAEALAPGGSGGIFQVRALESGQMTGGDLAASTVVIFVDPDPLGRTASENLRQWLAAGGVAAFLVGEPTAAGYLDSSLLPMLGLPSGANPVMRPSGQALRVQVVDQEHPVFAGLGAEAVQTLEDVTWNRWFALGSGEHGVLLELADESPLLITGEVAAGRFVLMPFNLLPSSGRLAGSPMALPFFQRLVAWMATGGLGGAAVNLEVGQRAGVRPVPGALTPGLDQAQELVVIGHDGGRGQAADLIWQGDSPRLVGDVLDRAGFVTFMAADDTLGMVAAQVPAEESITSLFRPVDWARQVDLFGLEVRGQLAGDEAVALAATLNGRDLAPWFFGLAFLLLLTELFVGRGVSGQKPTSG